MVTMVPLTTRTRPSGERRADVDDPPGVGVLKVAHHSPDSRHQHAWDYESVDGLLSSKIRGRPVRQARRRRGRAEVWGVIAARPGMLVVPPVPSCCFPVGGALTTNISL